MKCNDINKIYRTANTICSIVLSFMALSYLGVTWLAGLACSLYR
jgi:hypothetical protein